MEMLVLSILVIFTKKRPSALLKKVFVFQKICFKVKVLKWFKISIDCHVKTYRSLKLNAITEISSTVSYKNLCSFYWLQNEACLFDESPFQTSALFNV